MYKTILLVIIFMLGFGLTLAQEDDTQPRLTITELGQYIRDYFEELTPEQYRVALEWLMLEAWQGQRQSDPNASRAIISWPDEESTVQTSTQTPTTVVQKGKWETNVEENAWGDGDTIHHVLSSEGPATGSGYGEENAALLVSCNSGDLPFFVRFGWYSILLFGEYSTNTLNARYRFDRETPVQTRFWVGEGNEGGYNEYALTDIVVEEIQAFVEALLAHDTLRVYVEDYTGNNVEAGFDIRGLANSMAEHSECSN